ncbi:hypothetical protein ACIQXV_20060 [Neobacillus sp. NPDC097160]|uniref:hypothetical protein n=1 Tax=Neobacillus sp. NPDC097160 TaxID=3364298 RepID=UPI003805D3F4
MIFTLNFEVGKAEEDQLYNWTKEICEYQLHYHFERKASNPLPLIRIGDFQIMELDWKVKEKY